jgi:hypothetical protein
MPVIPASGSSVARGALVPIAKVTATSAYGRYFIFTNIPQIYQDLRIVFSGRTDASTPYDMFGMLLNAGEGGTINSETYLTNGVNTVSSVREVNLYTMIRSNIAANGAAPSIFSSATVDLLNYRSATAFKTVLARTASDLHGLGSSTLTASLARITSPVTSLNIGAIGAGGNLVAGSTATLYGMRSIGQ